MKINILTLFPNEMMTALSMGVVGRAIREGILQINLVDWRHFGEGRHRVVDDRPYGGGDGMLLTYDRASRALGSIPRMDRGSVVHFCPKGTKWTQDFAKKMLQQDQPLTLICSRYGGLDQRFVNDCVDIEISVGDFVLSGGEPAALCVVDTLGRLLPGTLGHELSAELESFTGDRLEAPQFTRSKLKAAVPTVLVSGNHSEVDQWKLAVAAIITKIRRPDLIERTPLNKAELDSIAHFNSIWTDAEIMALGQEPAHFRSHANRALEGKP